MGFRFGKSIKLFPGVRLNLSKSGISASVGRPGATVNIGRRGVRATTGIPGSGLSYSTDLYRTGGKGDARRQAEAAIDERVPVPAEPSALPDVPPPAPANNTFGTSLIKRLLAKATGRA